MAALTGKRLTGRAARIAAIVMRSGGVAAGPTGWGEFFATVVRVVFKGDLCVGAACMGLQLRARRSGAGYFPVPGHLGVHAGATSKPVENQIVIKAGFCPEHPMQGTQPPGNRAVFWRVRPGEPAHANRPKHPLFPKKPWAC